MNRAVLYLAAVCSIVSGTLCAQTIHKAEYFFDVDPGVGNGTPISISAGDPVTFSTSISTTGLGAGPHYLFIRTRTSNYKWSLSEPRLFNIAGVVEAEYFVDSDPGTGNATPLAVTPGQLTFTENLPTTGLTDGPHIIYMRTRQETGHWSIPEPRYIYIRTRIMLAEYFFDADPGFGNGTPITMATPSDLVSFISTINVGSLPDGPHHVLIRTKDALGIWSMFEPLPFIIDPLLPIQLLVLQATTQSNGHVKVEWVTETEVDNDYFTVQHSTDGMEFKSIGNVPGSGNSFESKHYTLVHATPSDGRNYYRLKQTDFNGTSTLSRIVSADLDGLSEVRVFPNPAAGEWFIGFPSEGNRLIELFDVLGRKCMSVISSGESRVRLVRGDLAAGAYVVRITGEDGAVLLRKIVLRD